MKFNFMTFNHGPQGRIIIEDIAEVMRRQMRSLGHDMIYSPDDPTFFTDAVNIVVESFADNPRTVERMAEAVSFGCKILILATEEPTDNGFNHGLDPAMIERQNAFPNAANFAHGILHLVPGQHVSDWYGALLPSAHYELGWGQPTYESPDDIVPDHDFGFFGKMTWRREKMLAQFEQLTGGPVLRLTTLDVPRHERDTIMRRAKVILQIKGNDQWGVVSSTRCASALMFGRPVIAEPHDYDQPWFNVVHFSPTIDRFFVDAMAARQHWRQLHATQHARFKSELSPMRCLGWALKKIGVDKWITLRS